MNAGNFTLTPSANLEGGRDAGDLNQVLATFRRRSRLFLAVAVVIVAAVMLVTLQQTPRYAATANVMIDTRKHSVDNITAVLSDLPDDTSVVDTEVEILKSRSLAERVVNTLKLDQDPEFNFALKKQNPIQAALNAPVAAFDSLTHALTPTPSPTAQAQAESLHAQKQHEAVVDHVLKKLEVRRSGLTYVINIQFESTDPAKAAVIANTFADRYLLEQLEAKFDATQQATQWLNERLAELEPQVQAAESVVAAIEAGLTARKLPVPPTPPAGLRT